MDEYDPRRWDLMARERELLAAHEVGWLAPLAGRPSDWAFRRGFLDCVAMDGLSCVMLATELSRLGPLPALQLVKAQGQVDLILTCPHLSSLKRIEFVCGEAANPGSGRLLASDVELLASSDALSNLTSLSLRNNRIGPEGVRRLAEAPWLPGLCDLNLSVCDIGAAGMEALADNAFFSGLRQLDLSNNGLTAAAMQALAEADSLGSLWRLNLSSNEIDAAGAGALAVNRRLEELDDLDLSRNPLGLGGVPFSRKRGACAVWLVCDSKTRR